MSINKILALGVAVKINHPENDDKSIVVTVKTSELKKDPIIPDKFIETLQYHDFVFRGQLKDMFRAEKVFGKTVLIEGRRCQNEWLAVSITYLNPTNN